MRVWRQRTGTPSRRTTRHVSACSGSAVDFAPKRATDAGRDHTDVGRVEPTERGERVAQVVRSLGRRVDEQAVALGDREDRVRLERHCADPLVAHVDLDDQVGAVGEIGTRCTLDLHHSIRAQHVEEQGRILGHGVVDFDHAG